MLCKSVCPCSVAAADLSPKNVPPARFLHGETHFGFKSLPLLIPKNKPPSKDGGLYFGGEGGICFSAEKPRRLQQSPGLLLRAAFQIPPTVNA